MACPSSARRRTRLIEDVVTVVDQAGVHVQARARLVKGLDMKVASSPCQAATPLTMRRSIGAWSQARTGSSQCARLTSNWVPPYSAVEARPARLAPELRRRSRRDFSPFVELVEGQNPWRVRRPTGPGSLRGAGADHPLGHEVEFQLVGHDRPQTKRVDPRHDAREDRARVGPSGSRPRAVAQSAPAPSVPRPRHGDQRAGHRSRYPDHRRKSRCRGHPSLSQCVQRGDPRAGMPEDQSTRLPDRQALAVPQGRTSRNRVSGYRARRRRVRSAAAWSRSAFLAVVLVGTRTDP